MSRESRDVGVPQPGFFTLRRVKKGPVLPAIIYRPCPIDFATWEPLDRFYPLVAEIDGKPADIFRVWLSGDFVDLKTYTYWRKVRRHVEYWEPDGAQGDPKKPIDFARAKPPRQEK